MKKATREWARYQVDAGLLPSIGRDILDSEKKLRAENRDLRRLVRMEAEAHSRRCACEFCRVSVNNGWSPKPRRAKR